MKSALKSPEPETNNADTDTSDPELLDPATVRAKAGLTIEEMAALMAMSAFGYTAWERGNRRPGGPAFQLLRLLNDDPKTVAKALAP